MHEYTDGCASHYKSMNFFGIIFNICDELSYDTFIRNYFETSHAKGVQDASGGYLKNQLDLAVFRGVSSFKPPMTCTCTVRIIYRTQNLKLVNAEYFVMLTKLIALSTKHSNQSMEFVAFIRFSLLKVVPAISQSDPCHATHVIIVSVEDTGIVRTLTLAPQP